MHNIQELYNTHKTHESKTAWIIGKGPSLRFLKKEDIGEGLVITINQSIIKVEQLGLENIIISMQKDGSSPGFRNCCPSKECNACKFGSVYPKKAILLVHEHESIDCMLDYEPRYVFNNNDLGLIWWHFSALSSIKIAQKLGYSKLNFVSFDAHTSRCIDTYIPDSEIVTRDTGYLQQISMMREHLVGIEHKFITPQK